MQTSCIPADTHSIDKYITYLYSYLIWILKITNALSVTNEYCILYGTDGSVEYFVHLSVHEAVVHFWVLRPVIIKFKHKLIPFDIIHLIFIVV